MAMTETLLAMWYQKRLTWLSLLLLPWSAVFWLLITLRRAWFSHIVKPDSLPVPVVVIGNINLGGSGKTPLLIALALRLRQMGYAPGVISRGYGSRAPHYPFLVDAETAVELAGDEPLMIAQNSGCPVIIAADRLAAARELIERTHCDLILSDDGLQHYRLPRDLEIVVIDGERRLGNERLLPAGPLREPVSRLRQADWVVVNGEPDGSETVSNDVYESELSGLANRAGMQLHPLNWRRLSDGQIVSLESAFPKRVHAVAGIGNPQRFFCTLHALGISFIPHSFPDHHDFRWIDIDFHDNLPVVMTEKDAVKCRALLRGRTAVDHYWCLSVQAQLDEAFYEALSARLESSRQFPVL
jgi:tetraacyldisaccharide 4'-kinase